MAETELGHVAAGCVDCGHSVSDHYAIGAAGCHFPGCGCSRVGELQLDHGVHEYDGRWLAWCRYHGLVASGPVIGFALDSWARHLSQACLVATVETRAWEQRNADGELTAYVLPMDLWREIRSRLHAADDRTFSPGSPGGGS